MVTRSVSTRRSRRFGVLLTQTLLLASCMPAAEVTITVNGKLNGGMDWLGIFGGGAMPAGTPYTLVYTYDDTKGQHTQQCGNTGITGKFAESPGTAVLTIRGKSYTFGRRADAVSSAWRSIASPCSTSALGMEIGEGQWPVFTVLRIRVVPQGNGSLTQDKEWGSPGNRLKRLRPEHGQRVQYPPAGKQCRCDAELPIGRYRYREPQIVNAGAGSRVLCARSGFWWPKGPLRRQPSTRRIS